MSSTADTRAMPPPGGQEQPAQPAPSDGVGQAAGLSLTAATALVIGSIIGTGCSRCRP